MTGLSCRNAKDFVEIMRIIDHDLHLGLADGYENCVDNIFRSGSLPAHAGTGDKENTPV